MRIVPPISLAIMLVVVAVQVAPAEAPVSFSKQIAPILQTKCVACHGEKTAEADYRVDTFGGLMSSHGDQAPVVAGKPNESELLRRLVSNNADERMPAEADPLPASQILLIRKWIEQGAQFNGDSPTTPLVELTPAARHPSPPKVYPTTMPISALAFYPNGEELFVGGYHEITVWSFAGELKKRIPNQGERTYSINFHPKEPWLLSASGSPGVLGEVRLFNFETGKLISVVARANEVILDAQFNPDGSKIAIAMPSGVTTVIHAKTLQTLHTFLGHSNQVTAVAWDAEGKRIVTASRDHTAKVFDLELGRSIATFTGHSKSVNDVQIISNDHAISVGSDGFAKLWNLKDGKSQRDIANFTQPIYSVASTENQYFVSGETESAVFETKTHKIVHREESSRNTIAALLGSRTATANELGEVVIRDGEEPKRFLALPHDTRQN